MSEKEPGKKEETSSEKFGMSPEELEAAKARMNKLEYVGGKFVKKESEPRKETTGEGKTKRRESDVEKNLETAKNVEKEILLEKINAYGRLVAMSSFSQETAEEKKVSYGWQTVLDSKLVNQSMNVFLKNLLISAPFTGHYPIDKSVENWGVNMAVTISAITKEVPIYEEIEESRGWGPFKRKEKVRKEKGRKKEPILMNQISANTEDRESAYRIACYILGTEKKGYKEGVGMRGGNMFRGQIVLPKEFAQEVFEKIQENPSFVVEILRKLDPKLMENEETIMPLPSKGDKVIVVPENFKKNEREQIEMDPSYVKKY